MPFPVWFKQSHAARSEELTSITSTIADDSDLELFPGEAADADINPQLDLEQQNTPNTFHTSSQPTTPEDSDYNLSVKIIPGTMPTTSSPIDIATPTRNASSSPSSQGKKNSNFLDPDSQTSQRIMTTGTAFGDTDMSRSRQESFAAAKPISMNNPNRMNADRPRRESLAGSLVGGMSWGGVSVGSWIRDEYVIPTFSAHPNHYLHIQCSFNCAIPTAESNVQRP